MGNFISQSFFIPPAPINEKNCPDQKGRVFIVTGGYTGVGFELASILYSRNATVYVAGRSEPKASAAIAKIKHAHPGCLGSVQFLQLDLADLSTIKPAVQAFADREDRLDVLVNNAGVMEPPIGSLTAQKHDLQFGTNCLGPYLLYKLLKPLLERTAATASTASVRVAWAGSVGIEVASPKPGGMKLDPRDGSPQDLGNLANYSQTKTGNLFFARHFARVDGDTAVMHVCFNPGNLRTELQRYWGSAQMMILGRILLYPPIHGAYTELWAAISPEITPDKNGAYVWPWGRIGGVRPDVEVAARSEAEGGTGMSELFANWCEKETAAFV